MILSFIEPQLVKDIASITDKERITLWSLFMENPPSRYPDKNENFIKTLIDRAKLGIPGLREQVKTSAELSTLTKASAWLEREVKAMNDDPEIILTTEQQDKYKSELNDYNNTYKPEFLRGLDIETSTPEQLKELMKELLNDQHERYPGIIQSEGTEDQKTKLKAVQR
jgi:hypothetical protein